MKRRQFNYGVTKVRTLVSGDQDIWSKGTDTQSVRLSVSITPIQEANSTFLATLRFN